MLASFRRLVPRLFRPFVWVLYGVVLFVLLAQAVRANQATIELGSRAKERIVAPRTVYDAEATQRLREEAANKVEPVYTVNDAITQVQLNLVRRFYDDVIAYRSQEPEPPYAERVKKIKDELSPFSLPDDAYRTLASVPVETLRAMENVTLYLVEQILHAGVREEELERARALVDERMIVSNLSPAARSAVQEIARRAIVPNVTLDKEATEAARKKAADSVSPVYIYEGDTIVDVGQVINSEVLRKLKLLGLVDPFPVKPLAGMALFGLLNLGALHVSFRRIPFRSGIPQETAHAVAGFSALLGLLAMAAFFWLSEATGRNFIYLAPFAMSSFLATLILGASAGLVLGAHHALVAAFFFKERLGQIFDAPVFLVALLTVGVGLYRLGRAETRRDLVGASLWAGIAGAFALFLYALLANEPLAFPDGLQRFVPAFLSAPLAMVLAAGVLPAFEASFGILSPMTLLELANPNHPLLRKILLEAPGTYHHSLMVANLAEAAAEAIDADGLLCRVGAYYHDVGKTVRPAYFVENEMGGPSPHEHLSPFVSRDIIFAHVTDGVRILEEHRFPKAIVDIAAQHHGTSVLRYFYVRAREHDPDVRVEAFRYPGPKPQFKEAAIVMLADSVEATVRSLKHPTPEEVEAAVNEVIREKIEDGQLGECDLTMREIELIRRAFLETLAGIFHRRIEYPKLPTAGPSREVERGGSEVSRELSDGGSLPASEGDPSPAP
ncbi:HD family phosphohydrolase [Brockia lithotrophica]|uniref:HD domain-containing protein n=1 Tax=Brockia lithotrophica TaxID=933949 RepID=A0A660L4Y8_9BACL|nr:HDIG domain-containing metalloprotein [Brockia lithotrophica]RKQ88997.1 hypothetical protein C7438_0652 [Brockia lithotrophica]